MPRPAWFSLSAVVLAAFLPGCAALKEWATDPVVYERIQAAGEAAGHALANPANPVPWVELGIAIVGLAGTLFAGQKLGARGERTRLGLDRIPIPDDQKSRPGGAA